MVKDVSPGPAGTSAFIISTFGDALYFRSWDGALWKSDGTPQGTMPIDTSPDTGAPPSIVEHVGAYDFYTAPTPDGKTGLYRTDGTTAGTVLLASPVQSSSHAVVADKLLFFVGEPGGTAGSDSDLWTTDGTPAGTTKLKDFQVSATGVPSAVVDASSAGAVV